MRGHHLARVAAPACNDNGVVTLVAACAAPQDVLTVARRVCDRLAMDYVAGGSLLLHAIKRPGRGASARAA